MSALYLTRYAYPEQFIMDEPQENLNLIVAIPCYNEPDLISTLKSLNECDAPSCAVEIIVVINESENVSQQVSKQNSTTFKEAYTWATIYNSSRVRTYILYINDLPIKHAGVGLARKIAMDEAVRRFKAIGNKEGIIACFDADSTCSKNYLIELENHFIKFPKSPGCSIYFEHPLNAENSEAIIYYEFFLRYCVNASRYAGFPYAYQTVGSSMAVKSWAYQKQGGMNRRKAGEDFYFSHRIIPLGHYTELNTTKVTPSPRDSNRVPFGTGRAMLDWGNGSRQLNLVYNPQTFEDLKILLEQVDFFYKNKKTRKLPNSIGEFLENENFEKELERLQSQSNSLEHFRKHFFHWFDGFKVLKFVHFARDNFHCQVEIIEAIQWMRSNNTKIDLPEDLKAALLQLRRNDKQPWVKSDQTNL